MLRIIAENASAVFVLLGTIFGALLSFAGTWLLKKRELKLRLQEKVLDYRIDAHEQVIELANTLRAMYSLGYSESEGELARSPYMLQSPQRFDEWREYAFRVYSRSTTWLSTEVTRELNLLQDYMVNLAEVLNHVRPEDYPKIGAIVRYDLIGFSSNIEKLSFLFFSKDLGRLKLNDLEKWHKYPPEKTEAKLKATSLFTRRSDIEDIFTGPLSEKITS